MTSSTIPDEMMAAQVVEFHKPYKVHKIPVPKDLDPQDLLIKVAVASLCHTDFMVMEGIMGTPLPCTGSHEGAGTVVAVGSAVKDFKVGDRVMSGIIYHPCGTCSDCMGPENYRNYCTQSGGYLGVTTSGFFAEYARIDSTQAAKVPDCVSFKTAAPMACAGGTIWRAVTLLDLDAGQWIALVGSGGGLGHLGVQFAKKLGLKVIGIDARDEGLELTRNAGADEVFDARKGKEEVAKKIHELTDGGVPVTIVISDADTATALGCAVTQMHGTVIQLAQPDQVKIPFQELIFRDIRVRSSLICSPEEGRQMLRFVGDHGISVETNPYNGLENIEKVIKLAEGGKMKGKGIIIMDQEQIG